MLVAFAISAAVVAAGLCTHRLNHLTAGLAQAVFSVSALACTGIIHPGVIYMLVIHAILAMIAGIWVDGLTDT